MSLSRDSRRDRRCCCMPVKLSLVTWPSTSTLAGMQLYKAIRARL